MKKTNNFEKFLPKKKNSAIKEEFRQIKRKEKQARAEAIELRKASRGQDTGGATSGGFRGKRTATGASGPSAKPAAARGGALRPAKSAAPEKPVKISKTRSGKTIVKQEKAPASGKDMPLNKYIAHCGVCSRRDAAELVKTGKVKVNGEVITEPGHKVTPDDDVRLNNKKIYLAKNLVYILLNKPKDYITTAEDPQGRKTVLSLVKEATTERIFPVGRLDRNTTGVLLLTNDGDLAQKLTHPSYEVRKVYEVKLDKPLKREDYNRILAGVALEDGLVKVDALAYADSKDKSVVGIELHSGKNRVVRRIFESLGYDVRNLDRVMFANLTKKNVERGTWRFLKDKEIRLLKFMNSSFIRKPTGSKA